MEPKLQHPTTSELSESIMREGENCWRVRQAEEAGFLIDGEAYFHNLYENLQRAKHAIYILGWDLDSRIDLLQGDHANHEPPSRLDEFLASLLSKRPDLHIYILAWDFSPVFVLDREFFQSLKFRMGASDRLHFHFDSQHPFTASQHQKIVVMDDQLAWCGGLDLTAARWDIPGHAAHDKRRRLINGKGYPPHHDVQMVVTGDVATSLGDLCRQRWLAATGQRLAPPPAVSRENYVLPDNPFKNVDVGIARTYPSFKGEKEIREVERLYVDAIQKAKRFIYLENQYFTSDSVSRALAESLQQPEGPEIMVMLPIDQVGLLAKIAMRNLSLKIAHKLKAVDRYKRFHVYSPIDENLPKPWFRNIHSKVAIFDFAYVRVGSANLNNRSMGLDSECDLMIDARQSPPDQEKIARFFANLLSEHASLSVEDIVNHIRKGTIVSAVEHHTKNHARDTVYLMPHVQHPPGLVSDVVEKLEIFDLQKSTTVERMLDRVFFTITKGRRPILRNLPIGFSLTILYSLVMATMMVFGPLSTDVPDFASHPAFWIILGVAAIILPPLNFGFVTIASFAPFLPAVGLGMLWGIVAACVGYGIGSLVPKEAMAKFCPTSMHLLSQRIARYRIVDIFILRFFPLTPYASLNLAAGALGISFPRYLLGTVLGVLPGAMALASFQRTLIHAFETPNLTNLMLLLGLLVLISLVYDRLQNRFINAPKGMHEGLA